MKINELVKAAHENAVEKGFWDNPREIGTLIALIHSEVTEALDTNTCEEFCEELADICIRIFDLCGGLNVDLETILNKAANTVVISTWDATFSTLEKSFNDSHSQILSEQGVALDVHSCLSYALEADRNNNKDDFAVCIAGAFLLTLFWAASRGYKIENALIQKMEKNRQRPRLHGKSY